MISRPHTAYALAVAFALMASIGPPAAIGDPDRPNGSADGQNDQPPADWHNDGTAETLPVYYEPDPDPANREQLARYGRLGPPWATIELEWTDDNGARWRANTRADDTGAWSIDVPANVRPRGRISAWGCEPGEAMLQRTDSGWSVTPMIDSRAIVYCQLVDEAGDPLLLPPELPMRVQIRSLTTGSGSQSAEPIEWVWSREAIVHGRNGGQLLGRSVKWRFWSDPDGMPDARYEWPGSMPVWQDGKRLPVGNPQAEWFVPTTTNADDDDFRRECTPWLRLMVPAGVRSHGLFGNAGGPGFINYDLPPGMRLNDGTYDDMSGNHSPPRENWVVRVDAPGYSTGLSEPFEPGGFMQVRMDPSHLTRLQLVDNAGEPVADATAKLIWYDHHGDRQMARWVEHRAPGTRTLTARQTAISALDGIARFADVPPGPTVLVVTALGRSALICFSNGALRGVEPTTVTLTEGELIRGRITGVEMPLRSATIRIAPDSPYAGRQLTSADVEWIPFDLMHELAPAMSPAIDLATGEFVIRGLQTGSWKLQLSINNEPPVAVRGSTQQENNIWNLSR